MNLSIHKDPKPTYNIRMNNNYDEIHLQKGEVVEITADMIIGDVIAAYPEVKKVFDEMGIHCASCYAAMHDSIAEGAMLHNIDPHKLCKKINNAIKAHRKA